MFKYHFPIVIIDEDYHSENVSGLGIRDLAQAIEAQDIEVRAVTAFSDLTSLARQASLHREHARRRLCPA